MKITILGAGNIGGTLGGKWLVAGHEIMFGVRNVNSPKTLSALEQAKGAKALSVEESISTAEVILFSIPWISVPEVAAANAKVLNGKIILDATNNFGGPIINNLSALTNAAPSSRIYRAFNSLGWEVFAQPVINGQQVDMFYSGPKGQTRSQVHGLIEEIGLNPIWVGDNDRIHLVDNIGALWVNMVFQHGWKRKFGFKAISE
jgi:8-hydroxy-5-deazaflavin:NADPH oxidoreductase